jgi:hypothetical protein
MEREEAGFCSLKYPIPPPTEEVRVSTIEVEKDLGKAKVPSTE